MDIFMPNIGKLLSSKLVPVYTSTSNVGAYLFHYLFTNLHSLRFGKKITVFKIVIVSGYWNKFKQCQVSTVKLKSENTE